MEGKEWKANVVTMACVEVAHFHVDVRWTMGHVPCLPSFRIASSVINGLRNQTRDRQAYSLALWHTFVNADDEWKMEKLEWKTQCVKMADCCWKPFGKWYHLISFTKIDFQIPNESQKEPCMNKGIIHPISDEPTIYNCWTRTKSTINHHKSGPYHSSTYSKNSKEMTRKKKLFTTNILVLALLDMYITEAEKVRFVIFFPSIDESVDPAHRRSLNDLNWGFRTGGTFL